MRHVVWSIEATDSFDSAIHFISKESAKAAQLIADRLERAIHSLAEVPTGHPGRIIGTYEWAVQKTPYVIAYTLSDAVVRIADIVRGHSDWPEDEWPAK